MVLATGLDAGAEDLVLDGADSVLAAGLVSAGDEVALTAGLEAVARDLGDRSVGDSGSG